MHQNAKGCALHGGLEGGGGGVGGGGVRRRSDSGSGVAGKCPVENPRFTHRARGGSDVKLVFSKSALNLASVWRHRPPRIPPPLFFLSHED